MTAWRNLPNSGQITELMQKLGSDRKLKATQAATRLGDAMRASESGDADRYTRFLQEAGNFVAIFSGAVPPIAGAPSAEFNAHQTLTGLLGSSLQYVGNNPPASLTPEQKTTVSTTVASAGGESFFAKHGMLIGIAVAITIAAGAYYFTQVA